MEDLVGKKIIGFKFSDGPGFPSGMERLIGQEGTIKQCYNEVKTCGVVFKSGERWAYPYPEILDHLVENNKSVEELLNEMKHLTSQIWKTKI